MVFFQHREVKPGLVFGSQVSPTCEQPTINIERSTRMCVPTGVAATCEKRIIDDQWLRELGYTFKRQDVLWANETDDLNLGTPIGAEVSCQNKLSIKT
jgi:hypothetical protein